jgi:acetyl-CoA carboxylase carboxyl transferase subunit alpha
MKRSSSIALLPHEKEISEHEETIELVKEKNEASELWSQNEIAKMEKKVEKLKQNVYANLQPWDRVSICRHPSRPHTIDYIQNLCDEFIEVFGDRSFRDDPSIIAGFAKIGGQRFMLIGQEKGKDTESRLFRNFGMPHPEGYRKALRCMQLAAKFNIPVITLLDTPGAFPGLSAEERGQGYAIAKNLLEMARLPVPVIVLLIGEGCSGGALGMGIGDVIGMLEHSYYSVISPEGCASILWKDSKKNSQAASALKLLAEDLIELNIIDEMIPEPMGGGHHDPHSVYQSVKSFILKHVELLKNIPIPDLLEARFMKFRKMGKFTIQDEALTSSSNTKS